VTEKQLYTAAALMAFVLAGQGIYAATQGSQGVTSTATTVITVVIPDQFRISGLSDFMLGTYSGSGAMTANRDLCVYTNGPGDYHVTVTDSSSMTPSGYSVQNATATEDIAYTVKWNDRTGTSGNVNMPFGTTKVGHDANTVSTDCSIGGNSANLLVNFTQANLRAAPGGVYSATMTVEIEP
jgi:hypothetical protein